MPGLSKVIVIDPDARAGRQVQLGFEREGMATLLVPAAPAGLVLPDDATELVIVGGTDADAVDLLRRARRALDDRQLAAPIVFTGRGVRRTDAEAAGADEVVLRPAFLRDVVTIGRLLRQRPAGSRHRLVGNLAETTGVYTLVRALAALGRSAVLTLMRGLRRGEIRFFHGEVTSAQVGLIHGQAALHQLLLWTEARFEFHHEDVVRRQQIPMSREELFADAERFLEGVRDASGGLSPSIVLEQDGARMHAPELEIPREVLDVLRMFDGHRVLADVLEDSPYRVFETLRVTQRAVDEGLLRPVDARRPRSTWRAVLAIEEWLVGGARTQEATRPPSEPEPATAAEPPASQAHRGSRRRRKRRRPSAPAAVNALPPTKPSIDWGALVPRVVSIDAVRLSGVVPASHASGEIEVPTREAPRERLEALMDTGARERIFPSALGIEPTVVLDADAALVESERAPAAAAAAAAAEDQPTPAPATPEAPVTHDAQLAPHEPAAEAEQPAHIVAVASAADAEDSAAALVRGLLVAAREPASAPAAGAAPVAPAPEPNVDEPSDGVVRVVEAPKPTPMPAPPPASELPFDDRPEAATGEIVAPFYRPPAEPPVISEPSIMVADLAAVHSDASAVAAVQAAAPPSPDIASEPRAQIVAHVRADAQAAFSEIEEEFFRSGVDKPSKAPVPAIERFDDLDEGYQPAGFWDRLRGKPKKP